jgi:hypothetical protein
MKSTKVIGFIFTLVVLANMAKATTVATLNISGTKSVADAKVTTYYDDDNGWTYDWDTQSIGLQKLTVSGDAGELWNSNTLYGFSAEYFEELSSYKEWSLPLMRNVNITETYNIKEVAQTIEKYPAPGSYLNADKATALSELWGAYYDESWQTSPDKNDKIKAAAFQTCVWEIIADYNGQASSLDLRDDSFMVSIKKNEGKDEEAIASGWLSSLPGLINDGKAGADLRILQNDEYQNFLVEVTNTSPIPEPATLLLVLSAVPCLIIKRQRKLA